MSYLTMARNRGRGNGYRTIVRYFRRPKRDMFTPQLLNFDTPLRATPLHSAPLRSSPFLSTPFHPAPPHPPLPRANQTSPTPRPYKPPNYVIHVRVAAIGNNIDTTSTPHLGEHLLHGRRQALQAACQEQVPKRPQRLQQTRAVTRLISPRAPAPTPTLYAPPVPLP